MTSSKGALTLLNLVTVIAVAVAAFYFGEQSALRKFKKDDDNNEEEEETSRVIVEESKKDNNIIPETKETEEENASSSSSSLCVVTDAIASSSSSSSFEMVGQQQQQQQQQVTTPKEEEEEGWLYEMEPIGFIRSIYQLCVGTPRQGLLAPNSRGRIDIHVSPDTLLGLEHFSHVWILFQFHLNTTSSKKKKKYPTKIAPPALGGKKVGIFATRSPHRPNAIGFTLCKIDSISFPPKQPSSSSNKQQQQKYKTNIHIHISGIDLVDGTPVYDIKPFVPHYDSVGYHPNNMHPSSSLEEEGQVLVPSWVSSGLGKRRTVVMLPLAKEQLQRIMMKLPTKKANGMKFYGIHTGRDTSDEQAFQNVMNCILQVLSVDVRSAWQTNKARNGKFQAERANRIQQQVLQSQSQPQPQSQDDTPLCTQQIDNLLIKYSVVQSTTAMKSQSPSSSSPSPVNTDGSGADDQVVIHTIELIQQKGKKNPILCCTNNDNNDNKNESNPNNNVPTQQQVEEEQLPTTTTTTTKEIISTILTKNKDEKTPSSSSSLKNMNRDETKLPNIDTVVVTTTTTTTTTEQEEDHTQDDVQEIEIIPFEKNNIPDSSSDEKESSKGNTNATTTSEKKDNANDDDDDHHTQDNLQAHIHEICELNEKKKSSKTETETTDANNHNALAVMEGSMSSSSSSLSNGSFVMVDNLTPIMPVSEISIVESTTNTEEQQDDKRIDDDDNNTKKKETIAPASLPKMDENASFSTLKQYWARRGSNYTPDGLAPDKEQLKPRIIKPVLHSNKPKTPTNIMKEEPPSSSIPMDESKNVTTNDQPNKKDTDQDDEKETP